jgi:tetratricopeptide (TPR) repeat protein
MSAKDHYVTGLKQLGEGDPEGAVDSFHKSVEADPTFCIGYLGWSQALDRLGKVDEAIVQAKRAIEVAPDEALAYTSLSRLYQQKDMIPEAEEAMAKSQALQKE